MNENASLQAVERAGVLTMSSREIAELTGKRHDHVMRDIRTMLETLGENTGPNFGGSYQDSTGRSLPCFNLPERECIILVSGYDIVMRARIIDQWREMKAGFSQAKLPNFDDPRVLTQLLLEHAGKRIEAESRAAKAEAEVEAAKPKIEAHDRIAESFGSVCRRIAAKNLGIPPLTLNRWMRTNGWTYRLIGGTDDLAYQAKMAAGLLEHKVETGEKPDGTTWTRTSVRVTPKGMLALARAFPPAVAAA